MFIDTLESTSLEEINLGDITSVDLTKIVYFESHASGAFEKYFLITTR